MVQWQRQFVFPYHDTPEKRSKKKEMKSSAGLVPSGDFLLLEHIRFFGGIVWENRVEGVDFLEKAKQILVLQKDLRWKAAAQALEQAGWTVVGPLHAAEASVWALPLPLRANEPGLAEGLQQAKPGTLVLGGSIAPEVYRLPRAEGVELVDYYGPELAEKNAVPTAEGCIALLMAHSPRTLWHQRILITGFGRVARALAVRLTALGAEVVVAARDPAQRALAAGRGCRTVPLDAMDLPLNCSIVVNTVPAMLLGARQLAMLPPHSLVVDLASKPGGTDFAAAKQMGHTTIHALGLPGQCAPETAGTFLAEAILQVLQRRSDQF